MMDAMACERCAYLESELGLQVARTEVDSVSRGLKVSRSQARILIALYRTRRVLSELELQDAAVARVGCEDADRFHVVQVHICKIRPRLGKDAVLTSRGLGYRLGESGRALLSPILEPAP